MVDGRVGEAPIDKNRKGANLTDAFCKRCSAFISARVGDCFRRYPGKCAVCVTGVTNVTSVTNVTGVTGVTSVTDILQFLDALKLSPR